ncbi:MAG TPA: hypothetical protein GX693_04030 [Firmicutes bacterium]|nr:hypothetical protein [Bacillota bacterium]
MRTGIWLLIKIAVLTVILFILFGLASALLGLGDTGEGAGPEAALSLLAVCFLFSLVLSYPIIRSRWHGWRLILTIFVVFYGAMTLLSQIETVVFLNHLVAVVSAETLPKLFLQGLIIAALFTPLTVLIHGKIKQSPCNYIINSFDGPAALFITRGGESLLPDEQNLRLIMPVRQWLWKLAVIVAAYLFIYIFFGQFVFIPLAGEAFHQYYAGLQMPSWILPFQALRALIWVALALPVIRMMKGAWWEAGLAVSLLFAVLMGALLLIPQPFMPEQIRLAHFVELITSNFLFGWIIVFLLHRCHGKGSIVTGYIR